MASKNKYVKSMIKGDISKNDFFMLTYQTPGNCDSIVNNTISSNLKYSFLDLHLKKLLMTFHWSKTLYRLRIFEPVSTWGICLKFSNLKN